MSADFYAAILSFIITATAVLVFGWRPAPVLTGPQQQPGRLPISVTRPTLVWALLVSGVFLLLNVIFR
jgi:hypothetical protein